MARKNENHDRQRGESEQLKINIVGRYGSIIWGGFNSKCGNRHIQVHAVLFLL